jgi:hypothetical protein
VKDEIGAVEGVPVRWVSPAAPQEVALRLTHLGGSADAGRIA